MRCAHMLVSCQVLVNTVDWHARWVYAIAGRVSVSKLVATRRGIGVRFYFLFLSRYVFVFVFKTKHTRKLYTCMIDHARV